jgi:hypothetical protein
MFHLLLLLSGLLLEPAVAFQAHMPQSRSGRVVSRNIECGLFALHNPAPFHVVASTTQLSMYNLPPSGGGGGGGGKDDNAMTQVLQGAFTIGAIVLFFASPLGGIFFAITNSLFLLALITPVILTIAFQIWQSLNTIEGPCPSCGAPRQRVFKDPAAPGICFNCGSIIQASPDLKSIELSTPVQRGSDFVDMDQPGRVSPASIFDIFGDGLASQQQPTVEDIKAKESKFRRERTVIDVEVKDDD